LVNLRIVISNDNPASGEKEREVVMAKLTEAAWKKGIEKEIASLNVKVAKLTAIVDKIKARLKMK